jgi:DNA-binding SARP family transcriptional activator
VEFRILGPLEVVGGGRKVPLGGARQRTLLALLLTRANEVVSTDRLIDELWGARPPRSAANALQYHISRLRKMLAPSEAILTQEPGYMIRVGPDELDLLRFEQLVEKAHESPPDIAADMLREALGLWRGPPLGDLAHQSFAEPEIRRLEEIRIAALERRIDADLALGRHGGLVGELEALIREYPFREPLRAQLMLSLYRSGRQAEALDVYRETRGLLVEELGIEPSPALQELDRAILRQDSELLQGANAGAAPHRAVVVVAAGTESFERLLLVAEPLARQPPRELILVQLLQDHADVASATATLAERRRALAEHGVSSRVAAFTTVHAGNDAVRLATPPNVDLVLVEASPMLLESGRPDENLSAVLERVPCDVGVLVGSEYIGEGPVVTPFGGAEHDWSAIEIAAWLAASLGTSLRLLGTEADDARGRRDASRLLARASLLVQQVIGIVTEPVLVPAGERGVTEAAHDARLLVIGLSDRWATEGIGSARLAVAARARVPILFVRHGLRPGGLAAPETLTRFTWTLASEQRRSSG